MDPDRRELYVEGRRDRVFLNWLSRQSRLPYALVREIAFVDIPGDILGGERGRLLAFAAWLEGKHVAIRCFADADMDRLLARRVPTSVWLTDHRDMEGYVLRDECLDKVLRLGLATEAIDAAALLKSVCTEARKLGILRLLSERGDLKLPFQNTPLRRRVRVEGGHPKVQIRAFVSTLLQNAGIALNQLDPLLARLSALEIELAKTPDKEIIHGKDAFCLLEKALQQRGVRAEDAVKLLWTSFEERWIETGSNLQLVLSYICEDRRL